MLRTFQSQTKSVFQSTQAGFVQQIRNTFILKRRWPQKLHKKGQKPEKLRGRHFNYDLVEDTTIKRKPNLEVILTSFVDGIGQKGEVVSLRPNQAYHKLLLPGLAVYNSPQNLERYGSKDLQVDEVEHSSPFAERTVSVLQSLTFSIVMSRDHPWKIEPWHLRVSFRKMGIVVPEEAIELPKEPITGPDMEKQNKIFFATVTVNNCEKARVKCRIHHWSNEPEQRIEDPEFFKKLPEELLFPTDATQPPVAKSP